MGIEYEKRVVRRMLILYCGRHHGGAALCPSCSELLEYAEKRLARCRYGDGKPQCKNCPEHCFVPRMRARIAEVMRYSGPRMLFVHPWMAVRHLLNRRKP